MEQLPQVLEFVVQWETRVVAMLCVTESVHYLKCKAWHIIKLTRNINVVRHRDFVVQVIGKPVVMAGNSIGGYISTCMAADNRSIVGPLN